MIRENRFEMIRTRNEKMTTKAITVKTQYTSHRTAYS